MRTERGTIPAQYTNGDNMDITQTFYDSIAAQYDKLFSDWQAASRGQADMLDGLFRARGFERSAKVLDCACGIGTQAIGLARLGYRVAASDISAAELAEAEKRAIEGGVSIRFERADFRALESVFDERFDIAVAMDNALPHMLTHEELAAAIRSITGRLRPGGLFAASIRDYDSLLTAKPPYSPPYVHKTECGKRVSFQTWDWQGENYRLTQYMIDDEGELGVSRFECEYRAVRRSEITELLTYCGCSEAVWLMPEETGFYQPIVIAVKCDNERRSAVKTVFESESILYTELSEELVKDYLAMVNDIEHVARLIGPRREPIPEEKEISWVRKKLAEGAHIFSMLEKETGEFIGNIELMDLEGGSGELGIAITHAKQEKGYGTEAIPAVCEYWAAELGLERITLKVYLDNARAIHVYEKCGFREYGRNEKEIFMEQKA